jgi:hypothetical protein
LLEKAGFVEVKMVGKTGYRTSQYTIGVTFTARKRL